jgi:hypothetical protein
MTSKNTIILPLFRPQYVSASEGFINALAWSLREPLNHEDGSKIGLRFRGNIAPSGNLKIVYTEPTNEKLAQLEKELFSRGLITSSDIQIANSAVVSSVLGVRTDSGKFQPASPLGPNLALLQNVEGLFGSENPPPLAEILEQIFRLGDLAGSGKTVAGMWLDAAKHRIEIDPVLSAIDESIGATVFGDSLVFKAEKQATREETWDLILADTPFTWFANVWPKITSDAWVEALPARVWTDWATAILRMAYGLCYLWESAWYESIASSVISDVEDKSPLSVKSRMDTVLAWRKKNSGADIRDLSSRIKTRSQRAFEIRGALDSWLKENSNESTDFKTTLELMARDGEFVFSLREALKPKKSQSVGKGLREAIRYALITRGDSTSNNTDYYGLLRMSGSRYLFPEPGIEWVAVMSSMACATPGGSTYLSDLARDLATAGLRPDPQELIELLEKAGLARGSADADQGVVVEAAY